MLKTIPAAGEWPRGTSADHGFDDVRLSEAVAFALDHEIDWPTDLSQQSVSDDATQWSSRLGPVRDRGGPAGLVVRNGTIIAEWGDVGRVDLTFSATKSYLATVAGLAFDRGTLKLDEPVAMAEKGVRLEYSPKALDAFTRLRSAGQHAQPNHANDGAHIDGFDTTQNESITWRQLLQQTSEWEGWLFGKPDIVDWNRGVETGGRRDARCRAGEHWEYNDVRVNRTGLALLALWGEPLPEVLRRHVMGPIGASADWVWHGYGAHSSVLLDGVEVESVSGGAHWGGGLWVDCYDHARFGLLFARSGAWGGQQIVSREWCDLMTQPCEHNPAYGLMWWLNTGDRRYGNNISSTAFAASGAGGNSVICDPEADLVIVTRWCADVAGVADRVGRALLG